MKKKKNWKPRLPREAIETLRHRGGAHGSPRGKRGYSRQREKSAWRKQMDNNSVCFFISQISTNRFWCDKLGILKNYLVARRLFANKT